MRPEDTRRGERPLGRRVPLISITTATVAAVLALALFLGDRPTATGMPARSSEPLVATPRHVEETYGDDAARALASSAAPAEALRVRTLEIGRGDTLMGLMVKAGAARRQAHAAIEALKTVQDPRRLRPGQALTLSFEPGGQLVDVSLDADVERLVTARLDADGDFRAKTVHKALTRDGVIAAGTIDDSLYSAAEDAGVPVQVIVDLIHLYSFDIDFQRDIHPGDRFELLYEVLRDASGAAVKSDDVLYARLTVGGKALALYRFRHDDGEIGYYNAKGESVRKALMKTPVDGARLSSRYGMRKHPILGYTRMHRGLDFAAPRGTPVMAAGDGRIETAKWNGGYGRFILIRHNTEFETAYAHLSRLAKGIHAGARVRQGEIIGYVGTTGRSTGPHLHYEVRKDGKQINPMGLKLPTGRKLKGRERTAFQAARRALDARYAALADRALARLAESQ